MPALHSPQRAPDQEKYPRLPSSLDHNPISGNPACDDLILAQKPSVTNQDNLDPAAPPTHSFAPDITSW